LGTALKKLGEKAIGRMPVVNEDNPRQLLGLITRKNIIKAYNQHIQSNN